MSNEPLDLSKAKPSTRDTAAKREAGEAKAGRIDGRTLRRSGRNEALAMKTTNAKRQQLERLATLTDSTFVEVFEAALDAYEEKLERERVGGQ